MNLDIHEIRFIDRESKSDGTTSGISLSRHDIWGANRVIFSVDKFGQLDTESLSRVLLSAS